MNKTYELLMKIKEKPGLYLGKKTLLGLNHFLDGYCYYCDVVNKDNAESLIFNGFQEFVQERYKIKSTHNWAEIIRFYCAYDEEAFDRFYKLFEEFLKEHPENLE